MTAEDASRAKLKCFVISPIGDEGTEVRITADRVLRHIIRKALDHEYVVTRGDEDENPGAITPQIVASIIEADLVVADLSGFNPNVYYEVAIAHGFKKPTVHLQNRLEKPAFDLKDARLIRYDIQNPDAIENDQALLKKYAAYAVNQPQKVDTPLSGAKFLAEVDGSNDLVAKSNLEMSEQLRRLQKEVRAANANSGIDRSADIRGMRSLIENALDRGALTARDFRGMITDFTSEQFDSWATSLLLRVDDSADPNLLSEK